VTNDVLGLCSGTAEHHCHHLCPSGKYDCVSHDHTDNHGCICYPADYCDNTDYPCSPLHCPHNELTRCNGHNKCECYCSQDSHCENCPEQGFCINEQCVCESNNYCPGGNQYYCLKNFHCQHSEQKRCNSNDRCECFCNQDSECKNCPEKGFCVDGQCVCESHDYCAKGNHLYCMYLDATCITGFTAKCNGSNHCYCAYVPDTCSGHDVSKCYHLKCRPGEKKFCEGRTCTCKPLDYCKKGDTDCGHKTCDGTLGEVTLCGTNNTCQCLAIPDFCGGRDTSSCTHLTCNQYQVKVCDNGMCKCQLNPSCDSNQGLNHTCTSANTVLEEKDSNGSKIYKNCSDDIHLFPICLDGRCQCIFWKFLLPFYV
ncbi:tenascin-like, partial [Saccostrea cucullata]|uniref:tenascin-like n=1 Tax=Saccostrea cuccullata TaxID=36930 RepID=UPI002ED5A368